MIQSRESGNTPSSQQPACRSAGFRQAAENNPESFRGVPGV